MALHPTLAVRALTPADLAAADAILMAAFETASRKRELARYLALQPDGWLLATADGAAVGMGGATLYGPFAYIGLMAVAPDRQRQGIGQAVVRGLLARLETWACPVALLDASALGYPVYRGLGFEEDDTVSVYWRQTAASLPPSHSGLDHVEPLAAADVPAVAEWDARYFGARRERALADAYAECSGQAWMSRDATHALTGALFVQGRRLGPWTAATPEAAEALLRAALALPFAGPILAQAPDYNSDAPALLERYGFQHERRLRHMRRGGTPMLERRRYVYSQASFALG